MSGVHKYRVTWEQPGFSMRVMLQIPHGHITLPRHPSPIVEYTLIRYHLFAVINTPQERQRVRNGGVPVSMTPTRIEKDVDGVWEVRHWVSGAALALAPALFEAEGVWFTPDSWRALCEAHVIELTDNVFNALLYPPFVPSTNTVDTVLPPGLELGMTLATIRQAVADYMASEGCSCCQDTEKHKAAEKTLAQLLDVPMYDDASGYNFAQFARR